MSTTNEKMSLAAKLARIGKEIGAIKKDGRNTQQNYDYIEYGVVAGKIRELFDTYGIIIKPEVLDYECDEVENKYGNKGYHYVLKMHFTLINADDKEDIQKANWLGEAIDYGDKGINKAETSGVKYFLMRLFNVSEKGEKEADAASPEPIVRKQPQQTHYQGHADGRLDFDSLKSWLEKIDTVEEVKAAKVKCLEKYPKMTEKQRNAVDRIFATRIDYLENPDGVSSGWQEATKV